MKLLTLAATLTAAVGCTKNATEIVVTVDTSFGVPCTIDRVLFEITNSAGETQMESVLVGADDLPGSLTLVPDGSVGQLTIKVSGLLDQQVIAVAEQIVSFENEASHEVRFLLDSNCTGATCPAVREGEFTGLPNRATRTICGEERYALNAASLIFPRDACVDGNIGAVLGAGMDEVEALVPLDPLPFPFFFYGKPVKDIWVGDNGYVAFNASEPEALIEDVGDPRSIGELGFPTAGVLAFWDNLVSNTDGVCYSVTGSAPRRFMWFTWKNTCFAGGAGCGGAQQGNLTFSVGLEETSNAVIIAFQNMTAAAPNDDRARGQSAVIGLSAFGEEKACAASDCTMDGLCGGGAACGFTEFSALTTSINVPQTIEFSPVEP